MQTCPKQTPFPLKLSIQLQLAPSTHLFEIVVVVVDAVVVRHNVIFLYISVRFRVFSLFRLSDLIIIQVINHVTSYKYECSQWLKYSRQSECSNFNQ